MADNSAQVCFEVSWEVCNKVGGIYTVVKSKAARMKEYYGDDYFLVGPYFPKKTYGIFEEKVPPEHFKQVFDKLKQRGIEVHFGKWLIKGEPNVLLIDFSDFNKNADNIKKELWDWFKIDSLGTEYFDFTEPSVWSYAAGILIEELNKVMNKRSVAHFHEWLAGSGLLYLRHNNVNVGTVFTTHATTVGRAISNEDKPLYDIIDKINPDEEAKKRGAGTFAKHLVEKVCAHNAHVFTTVSEITGIEAEKILGKKPDVLLYNGLDLATFPSFEERSVRHMLFKNRIKNFLLYYFFPYYSFDLDDSLFFFIAGRYEFHDKGIDVLIDSLKVLNEKLKKEKSPKNIVCFFFIPGAVKAIRPELLENKTLFKDLSDSLEDVGKNLNTRVLYLLASKKEITAESLFDLEFVKEITPKLKRLKRKGLPPISTHELFNEDKDLILNALKSAGLDNSEDDKVKVIYYPIYLTGADGLLDTSYYESMIGGHLGVFPSCYEPWGYTPLECGALGVSAVTTDSAGFGRFIDEAVKDKKDSGIFVVHNYKKQKPEIVKELTDVMFNFSNFAKHQRVANKMAAQKIAGLADWRIFVKRYIEAENLAVDRVS